MTASHTREVLLLEASFLREDLPYFTELLGEVVSMTKYTSETGHPPRRLQIVLGLTWFAAHEFHEDVERVLQQKQAAFDANVPALALDYAHAVAFHSGLGTPIYPTPAASYQRYLNEEYIASFADVVYAKPNIVVVADGASPDSMSKWVGQFFREVPATPSSGQTLKAEPSKYHGGEQRTGHIGGSSMVIAFPGSGRNNAKPEIAVLAALLGGKPTIKWTPGFSLLSKATSGTSGLSVSATNLSYSDAGLLAIQLSGPAAAVRKAAEDTVKALKSVADGSISKEDVTRAVANAKFEAMEKIALRDPSMLMAGSGVLHTGKPWDIAALAGGFDSVTADKLKSVRL